MDPAPASEESPDRLGRHVTIRYATALRDMARLNQTDVVVGGGQQIHCPTQTEPSPQESLPMAATNRISFAVRVMPSSVC